MNPKSRGMFVYVEYYKKKVLHESKKYIVWMIVNNRDFEKREICSVETLTVVFTYLLPEVGIHP
jgi:hypothetical protein